MYKHPDCVNAFRNLFCWINFPRCNERGESLIMCRSACENYFISCGFEEDIWRCGDDKYFNGYEPEVPTIRGSEVIYMREYFPGSPWRTNKFNKENIPLIICTPSLDGAATRVTLLASITIVLLISILLSPFIMLWWALYRLLCNDGAVGVGVVLLVSAPQYKLFSFWEALHWRILQSLTIIKYCTALAHLVYIMQTWPHQCYIILYQHYAAYS